jgi:hypothetical protein
MRRLAIIVLGLAFVAHEARPATAAIAPPVRLCAAVSATDRRCYNAGVTYEAGRTVFLRGRGDPTHHGTAQVLRRPPGTGRWSVVANVRITDRGRARWSWRTRRRDIDGGDPYLFALRVNGAPRSNVVEVWVVAGDV